MIKEALKNFIENLKADKTQADYIREITEKNKDRAEERRRKKEESDYKENCKIIENIVYQKIIDAAKDGESFVEIYLPTLHNSITQFSILKDDYKEHFELRGYTFEIIENSKLGIVKISW